MKLGKVKYCKKCVIPSSSAIPVEFNDEGICSGCLTSQQIDTVDWVRREQQLKRLLDQYRSKDGTNYDCIIPVSSGKDSYFQIHTIKNIYGMNPLLVTYNANNWMPEGTTNLVNMRETFGCDHIFFTPSISLLKRLNRLCYRMMGDMNWHAHCGIQTYPYIVAVQHNVSLLIDGEHGFMDLGGMHSYSDYVELTQRFRLEHVQRGYDWYDMIDDERDKIQKQEMISYMFPSDAAIKRVGVRGIYLGNYIKWSGNNNAAIAKTYGWQEADAEFERTYRKISNLDDMHENGIHDYMKYIKFGYGRATDHVCKDIREGRLSREQGIEIVKQRDSIKPKDLYRWLEYVDMSEEEFDQIADSFRDPSVWERDTQGKWVKDNIWD
ncbi:MAG: N-acetyl sugar amidotransferase [Candidatus Marinimicrobia bacterium]|nr:N-acetyl sugar amidotransferase [Candidatus Neomarinimicrobiota bacterium]